ncbi:unnamed protein product [Effrenium voratum]|nr:unnamed protein product [Effrenium voratum]
MVFQIIQFTRWTKPSASKLRFSEIPPRPRPAHSTPTSVRPGDRTQRVGRARPSKDQLRRPVRAASGRRADRREPRADGPEPEASPTAASQKAGGEKAAARRKLEMRLPKDFNERPAFVRSGDRELFIFWSQQFGDWKIADRLQDDGACLGFAEDIKGRRRPWLAHPPLRWRLWEPGARRFVPRRLHIDTSAPEEEVPGGEWPGEEDEVPWSRPPWSQWSTNDLLRWCERRKIDITGCFDREAVLDRVEVFVREAQETADAGSESDRRAGACFGPIRIASRVGSDRPRRLLSSMSWTFEYQDSSSLHLVPLKLQTTEG